MEAPDVHYARSGDTSIAYAVASEGEQDIVLVSGFVSNVELMWQNPRAAPFYERLASLGRLIVFDKRGTGLSDRAAAELKGVPGEWRLYAVSA